MGRRIQRTSSQDLKKLLLTPTGGRFFRPLESFDEVFPGILLGDASTALSTCLLKELKVTHVLNAAYGKNDEYYGGFVNTSFTNYDQAGIKFMGVPALDTPSFYLRSYFRQAADFIEGALRSKGKVLIHCQCGISRSATLIAAYLMLKKGMDAQEALTTIRKHRSIFPNQGFLSQLCDFEYEMKRSGDLQTSGKGFEPEEEKTLKNPIYNPAFHFDRRPMFSSRNYTPISQRPISRSGYPLTSAYYDYVTRSRSRALSEDRTVRSMYDYTRSRSASPTPSSLRTYRPTSIMPESHYYEERPRATSVFPRTKYIETRNTAPVLNSYESSATPHQRTYYYTRTKTEPFIYTPRTLSRPVTEAYTRSRYVDQSLSHDVNSLSRNTRNNAISSSSPYESYSYASNYGNRSFSTYTPVDIASSRSSLGRSVSSTLRYPALYPATFRHSYLTGLKAC